MPTRRALLRATGTVGLAGVAGCLGVIGGGDGGERPDGVYVQPFVERMVTAGTTTAGDFGFGVMWTTPHRFWTPTQTDLTEQEKSGSVHLMALVWDPETRTVLPETGLSAEVVREGTLVSQEVIYPMLSQRMGFHYGGNVDLDGDGTYTVRISVAGVSTRRTGAFAGRFGDPATAAVEMEFTERTRERVSTREIDQGGQPGGAVAPMEMDALPDTRVPRPADLPGRTLGSATTDDCRLEAVFFPPNAAGRFTDGRGYVAVLASTPYNRIVLPLMGLEGRLTRGDERLGDGRLTRTLDPTFGYHYGLPVDAERVETGDVLSLSVTTPPQVSRHRGYETAFLRTGNVEIVV